MADSLSGMNEMGGGEEQDDFLASVYRASYPMHLISYSIAAVSFLVLRLLVRCLNKPLNVLCFTMVVQGLLRIILHQQRNYVAAHKIGRMISTMGFITVPLVGLGVFSRFDPHEICDGFVEHVWRSALLTFASINPMLSLLQGVLIVTHGSPYGGKYGTLTLAAVGQVLQACANVTFSFKLIDANDPDRTAYHALLPQVMAHIAFWLGILFAHQSIQAGHTLFMRAHKLQLDMLKERNEQLNVEKQRLEYERNLSQTALEAQLALEERSITGSGSVDNISDVRAQSYRGDASDTEAADAEGETPLATQSLPINEKALLSLPHGIAGHSEHAPKSTGGWTDISSALRDAHEDFQSRTVKVSQAESSLLSAGALPFVLQGVNEAERAPDAVSAKDSRDGETPHARTVRRREARHRQLARLKEGVGASFPPQVLHSTMPVAAPMMNMMPPTMSMVPPPTHTAVPAAMAPQLQPIPDSGYYAPVAPCSHVPTLRNRGATSRHSHQIPSGSPGKRHEVVER